ncbi:hypothetical protein [Natronorubrum halophilum]|uniref:hypothetical protein n=1 Tax=Natronorubrum halophilum TaxID=1702106 RepID=UPI001EE91AD8|nr:hypothetical protein [Natronorubrum halophilum]
MEEAGKKMMALLDAGQNEQALTFFLDDIAQLTSDELDELRSAPIRDTQMDMFHQTLLPGLEVAGEYE